MALSFQGIRDTALLHYVQGFEFENFSKSQVQQLIAAKKNTLQLTTQPFLTNNSILSAQQWNLFLRDIKLQLNILLTTKESLSSQVANICRGIDTHLDYLNTRIHELATEISEAELQTFEAYSFVHINNFSRNRDLHDQRSKAVDFRTGARQIYPLQIFPNTGITLPVQESHNVLPKNISFVDSLTDVGDTQHPLYRDNPNNLLKKDLFRYIIARKIEDSSSKKYNYIASKIVLAVEFQTLELINVLTIKPASSNLILLTNLRYLNEANEIVELAVIPTQLQTEHTLLIQPIKTNYLEIELQQDTPIELAPELLNNTINAELNKLLEANDWSFFLPEHSESFQARIHDFSLSQLSFQSMHFHNTGFFQSKPIAITNPLSASIQLETETIELSETELNYGVDYFLPEETTFTETYMGLIHKTKNQKPQECLFPIPEADTIIEQLPLVGNIARLRFFPDIEHTFQKYRIQNISYLGEYVLLTTYQEHNVIESVNFTDKVIFWAQTDSEDYNFTSTIWQASSATTFFLKRDTGTYLGSLNAAHIPVPYLIRQTSLAPVRVYKEETELILGTDYQISFDNQTTWLSDWPLGNDFELLRPGATAGNVYLKLVNPDIDKFYWARYVPLKRQFLHPNKLIRSEGKTILFHESLAATQLYVQLIMRAQNRIPFLSSLIQYYSLQVRSR